jgi:hypothetical protein
MKQFVQNMSLYQYSREFYYCSFGQGTAKLAVFAGSQTSESFFSTVTKG